MEPGIAFDKSASGKMIFGDLPPNSRVTRFIVSAAVFIIDLPTGVDPVKAILFTKGCSTRGCPAVESNPGTMLITPSGKPASVANLAKYKAVSGVLSAGLRITVQPVAKDAPNFHAAINNGKFHGIICPTTPTGSCLVLLKLCPMTGMVIMTRV